MTTTYTYTDINFPGSANQGTSVVGINNSGEVSGSYIATDGFTHGFTEVNGTYTTVDYPSPSINTTYGQKLNNDGDVVGYFLTAASPTVTSMTLVTPDGPGSLSAFLPRPSR